MNLLWPWFLLLLLLIPVAVAIYVWVLRRKRRFAVRYSSLSLIREALPKRSMWRRHIPFALFLLGLSGLVTAMARPVAEVEVPLSRTTIILALDVSRSMCATDVPPNRLTVAQDAALAFIDDQVEGTQIGIVAFADTAEVVVPPTRDKAVLKQAIVNMTTSLGTAIGSATLKSVDAIAEINPEVEPSGVDLSEAQVETEQDQDEDGASYRPDIIVLLTDGANTRGANPINAAQKAADRGLRVYTIGFGTLDPGRTVCTREQLGSDTYGGRFGGGGFGGGFGGGNFRGDGSGGYPRYLLLDEPTLRTVADMTGGEYYRAENADQLLDVFLNLPTQIVLQKETMEISVLFTALGGLFAAVAVGLSLIWFRFP
jgi:Ca-activated chloride channel family protein